TVNVTRYCPGAVYVFKGFCTVEKLVFVLSPKFHSYFRALVPFACVVLEKDNAELRHVLPKAEKLASGAGIKDAVNAAVEGGQTPLSVLDKVKITKPFSISALLGI